MKIRIKTNYLNISLEGVGIAILPECCSLVVIEVNESNRQQKIREWSFLSKSLIG